MDPLSWQQWAVYRDSGLNNGVPLHPLVHQNEPGPESRERPLPIHLGVPGAGGGGHCLTQEAESWMGPRSSKTHLLNDLGLAIISLGISFFFCKMGTRWSELFQISEQ